MPQNSATARWETQARALADVRPPAVPLHVLVGEAVELARFFDAYWEPVNGLPGLAQAGARVDRNLGEHLLDLRLAVQEAQGAYHLAITPRGGHQLLVARGEEVLRELIAVLEWRFDDGLHETVDQQLATLARVHGGWPASADRMAQALHDYGTLAEAHVDTLHGLGGFDKALVPEALTLARDLGDVGTASASTPQAQAALDLRDRLAALLDARMSLVRQAASFVFRRHPEVARKAVSAYARRRRRARQRGDGDSVETTV